MVHLVQTREAFEARLRTMSGLEFVTIDAPSPPDSSVWTIRKQIRRKMVGADDQVTVLSCYFVVGENVYMSPSLGNVLGSRLVRRPTKGNPPYLYLMLILYFTNSSRLLLHSPSSSPRLRICPSSPPPRDISTFDPSLSRLRAPRVSSRKRPARKVRLPRNRSGEGHPPQRRR